MIRDSCGLPVCPVHLCQRASYAEAPMNGLAPQELDPDGKAAAELEQLYRFILQQLTRTTAQHE